MARTLIPNSTQIPDVILDYWMAELSGAEFKVLLYIARRTYGFGKDSDAISLNQISQGVTRRDGTALDRGTGVSKSSVARALNELEERRIILRKTNRTKAGNEFEETTYSINLHWQPPGPSWGGSQEEPGGRGAGPAGEGSPTIGLLPTQNDIGVVPQSDNGSSHNRTALVPKSDEGLSQNFPGVVPKSDIQETDLQETDQETAAGALGIERGGDAAAGSLVCELVSHGVSRTAAERYAREKPEDCRRQLEYLPFATFRTTKGAYLANAIRDAYGPPAGYETERARKDREHEAAVRHLARESRRERAGAIRDEMLARVGEAYRELEKSQGEAFLAFCDHVEKERAKTARIANHLSPERREAHLAAFDRPERRLELFAAWIEGSGRGCPRPGATLPHADKDLPPDDPEDEQKGGLFLAQAS